MKVLIVGGGGREHALAWKAAQSADVDLVYLAPGNAGTATEPGIKNVAIAADDIDSLLQFATENSIGLTIIGPEAPLVAGIVDVFLDHGLPCFGPSAKAAQLEGSKSFSKDFLKRHNIPTADYETFIDIDQAINYIKQKGAPIVVKADGLAAGKGVIVAQTIAEAIAAVKDMLSENKFGEAGNLVVIEEFLSGEETSFIVMCDGEHILPLASSQDHKARDEADKGPNTGGMGAYSPAPLVTVEIHNRIMQEIIEPTVKGICDEGRPYSGFLYTGVIVCTDGTIKVLEFNCRFGDPETQPIMMRLKSDLVSLCVSAINRTLDKVEVEWDERVAVGVVLASAGYPQSVTKGDVIYGLDRDLGNCRKVFHAGTANNNENEIVTTGGRVLCVVALGGNATLAQREVYDAVDKIKWRGMFYRKDIAYRAIVRENKA